MNQTKTLPPQKAWFLGVMFVVVVSLFAFVVLPYVDPKKPSGMGAEAPTFGLELLNGGETGDRVRLSDLRGQVVVLDFFASWCKPCREQAIIVEQVASEFSGQDVYVLGVGTSDSREALERYLREAQSSYPAAFDEGNVVATAYGVEGIPTMVVVDRAGRIKFRESRVVKKRELVELVRGVLESD